MYAIYAYIDPPKPMAYMECLGTVSFPSGFCLSVSPAWGTNLSPSPSAAAAWETKAGRLHQHGVQWKTVN